MQESRLGAVSGTRRFMQPKLYKMFRVGLSRTCRWGMFPSDFGGGGSASGTHSGTKQDNTTGKAMEENSSGATGQPQNFSGLLKKRRR